MRDVGAVGGVVVVAIFDDYDESDGDDDGDGDNKYVAVAVVVVVAGDEKNDVFL